MTDDDTTQLYDTTGMDLDLPPKYRDMDLSLAESADSALIDTNATTNIGLVDGDTGEVYAVRLKEITWQKKNQILKNNVRRVGGDGKLDIDTYYRDVAEAMIVEVDPSPASLTQWLTGLKASLGEQLEGHLPDPVTELNEDEEGN